MRVKCKFVFNMEPEPAAALYTLIGQTRKKENLPPNFTVIEVFQDTPEYELLLNALMKANISCFRDEDEIFSKQELFDAPILRIVPNTHRGGYPQPENNYLDYTHDPNTGCSYCSKGRIQNRPLRLKSSAQMGASDISGIWWLRELLVNVRLKELIVRAGLTGCEFWPVIKHGKNEPFEDIFQLKITGTLPSMAAETKIIHDPFANGPRACPNGCGQLRVVGSIYYNACDLKQTPDFALTREWLGVGGELWRLPLLSHKAYKLFLDNKIKGVRFYLPVVK